jgi:hypothetical protein
MGADTPRCALHDGPGVLSGVIVLVLAAASFVGFLRMAVWWFSHEL